MERVTIKDIAKEANVSIGTVYRALNNKGRIKDETKQKILDIAARLDYRPNTVARKFALWNKFNILVVMPKEPDYYWDDINQGLSSIKNELSEFGLEIETFFILSSDNSETLHLDIIKILEEKQYDGLVIAPLHINRFTEIINYVNKNNIPLVLFNDGAVNKDRLFYYGPDNIASGRIAGELFSKLIGGRGNICIITKSQFLALYSERMKGFCEYIHDNHPLINVFDVITYNSGEEKSLLRKTLKDHPNLNGIYVMDAISAGIFGKILKEEGVHNLTLIGHEISPLSKKMLLEGFATALICEKKVCQGYYPVKLLYDYLVQGILPKNTDIFTDINIVIKENVNYLEHSHYGVGYK